MPQRATNCPRLANGVDHRQDPQDVRISATFAVAALRIHKEPAAAVLFVSTGKPQGATFVVVATIAIATVVGLEQRTTLANALTRMAIFVHLPRIVKNSLGANIKRRHRHRIQNT